MKLFLACVFLDEIDATTHQVRLEYRTFLQYILDKLREAGNEVYSSLEAKDWHVETSAPELGLIRELDQLKTSDAIIVLVNDRPSAGVQFELGYAAALGKAVILAHDNAIQLSWFNQGAVGAGIVTLITYDNVAKLADQLLVALVVPDEV